MDLKGEKGVTSGDVVGEKHCWEKDAAVVGRLYMLKNETNNYS